MPVEQCQHADRPRPVVQPLQPPLQPQHGALVRREHSRCRPAAEAPRAHAVRAAEVARDSAVVTVVAQQAHQVVVDGPEARPERGADRALRPCPQVPVQHLAVERQRRGAHAVDNARDEARREALAFAHVHAIGHRGAGERVEQVRARHRVRAFLVAAERDGAEACEQRPDVRGGAVARGGHAGELEQPRPRSGLGLRLALPFSLAAAELTEPRGRRWQVVSESRARHRIQHYDHQVCSGIGGAARCVAEPRLGAPGDPVAHATREVDWICVVFLRGTAHDLRMRCDQRHHKELSPGRRLQERVEIALHQSAERRCLVII
mmetsp:Transcript_28383/g.87981  ORF Transcript_28383/g.87981 Transcript_28383/m.87981 type:complete len:320 (-) Transcript_28383:826-1785(-)